MTSLPSCSSECGYLCEELLLAIRSDLESKTLFTILRYLVTILTSSTAETPDTLALLSGLEPRVCRSTEKKHRSTEERHLYL